MKRKGFAYIIAILVLGLLAFMGLFLQQSSTAEYSQASMSIYRTMSRQIAEAAADEAFILLERQFKDKNSKFFKNLIKQASSSSSPRGGGSTGLEPNLLGDFSDLKDKVTQVLYLKDYQLTKAGFVIEKIIPTIKDCRPIPNGPLDFEAAYHRSIDRKTPFDTVLSRDWYMTLRLDIRVALKKVVDSKLEYTISKDIKLLNMGPIARNYTMFSIHGNLVRAGSASQIQESIEEEMNKEDGGSLFLWNMPFQSRVYMHGPSIIALDNPFWKTNRSTYGAYDLGDVTLPGISHAYQYSDTFYGLSYYPQVSRAIFPPKGILRNFKTLANKDDASESIKHQNTTPGGVLPEGTGFHMGNILETAKNSLQDTYFRGTTSRQNFLPAGPFCRTPWKYCPQSPTEKRERLFAPNQLEPEDGFPDSDEFLALEHRWDPDDKSVAESTKIMARVREIKYNFLLGKATKPTATNESKELIEFAITYFNDPDREGLFDKFKGVFGSLFSSIWNKLKIPFQATGNLLKIVKEKIWPSEEDMISAETDNDVKNMYPTNFKYNFRGIVTKHFSSEEEIPMDEDNNWLLDGVYWLDSCQIKDSVTYIGTGTIVVSIYNQKRPFIIAGDVIADRDEKGNRLGHLNIIYNPYSSSVTQPSQLSPRMLLIKNNSTVEASVYSCYGIKTENGRITDFPSIGIYPDQPSAKWASNALNNVSKLSNVIKGNYVNFFMNLKYQNGDLWVVHDFSNPMYYCYDSDKGYSLVQDKLDTDQQFREQYEISTHEFYLSPKIQHMSFTGASHK